MSKTKLVHIVNDLCIGGVSRVLLDLCEQIDLEQYDVSIVCLSANLDMLNQTPLRDGIALYTFGYYFDPDYSLRRYLYFAFYEKKTLKRGKDIIDKLIELSPDILHFHILPRELMLGTVAKRRIPNVRLVYTDHLMRIGPKEYSWLNRKLLILAYRKFYKAYNVVSVSKSVQRSNRTNGFFHPTKSETLIENRIDCTKYDVLTKPGNNAINIIYVARLSIVKGHMDLLKAWGKLYKDYDIKLFLIGDGELLEDLKEYVRANIDNDSVIFTGPVNNVLSYLQTAHIAVFPSYKEGLPMALLEQMVCGLPIVASDIPELTDVIEHNKQGLIHKKGDIEDLKVKLSTLIKDGALRQRLGNEAKNMALNRFCNHSFGQEYSEFYQRLT